MDVSSNYNLLLGRPWVDMARAVPSTFHQCVMFEWGRTEVTIYGELSHPIISVNSIPVTDELDGTTFHTLEIMKVVRVNEEAEPEDIKLSSAAKIVASEMLKYGYQPKSGVGQKSNGIVEPIQLKHQRGNNGLGYETTLGRVQHGSSKTIFVLEQALIPDQAGIDEIVEGIGNLFVATAGEEEEINLNKLTIRDAEPGEIL
uniref:Gag/pol polyprotein n=1 Tax=Solanum tuberosum TaxID=4113 RepID=M1DM39_SOLTU